MASRAEEILKASTKVHLVRITKCIHPAYAGVKMQPGTGGHVEPVDGHEHWGFDREYLHSSHRLVHGQIVLAFNSGQGWLAVPTTSTGLVLRVGDVYRPVYIATVDGDDVRVVAQERIKVSTVNTLQQPVGSSLFYMWANGILIGLPNETVIDVKMQSGNYLEVTKSVAYYKNDQDFGYKKVQTYPVSFPESYNIM